MAAECSVKSLQDTVTCGLCQEYFTDPVSIHCGHSFCRACIDQRWGEWEINFACPQCGETARKRKISPNRELESVVRFAKRLKREAARGERVCEEHREPLRLFCKEEQKLLCAACSESKDHGAHELIPMEEAAQDCKAEIQTWLQVLREDREKLLTFKQARETSSQEFLEKVDAEKQKTRSQFEQLRQFLEEQEHFFLAQLQELVQRQDEYVAKLCQEISWLDALTDEMEEKCQQPAIDFLQDVGRTLIRCKKWEFQQPADNSVEQEQRLHRLSKRNIILEETIEKCEGTMEQAKRDA
uniref:Uncharacterized protein n=1 Tax=Sphenodon punctatus TaxID=8508 RepID=A0A8D0GP46_SPHPU